MWTVDRYGQPPVLNKINLQTTTYSEPLTHIKKNSPKCFFFSKLHKLHGIKLPHQMKLINAKYLYLTRQKLPSRHSNV